MISTAPRPVKLLRDLYARVFVLIYQFGESRSLFDTVSLIQNQLAAKKIEDYTIRCCLVHILGSISEIHSSKVTSLLSESFIILTKIFTKCRESEVFMSIS